MTRLARVLFLLALLALPGRVAAAEIVLLMGEGKHAGYLNPGPIILQV